MDNGKAVTQKLGPVTIALQDALEGMSSLSDSSFDLAIADPPYGASSKAVWQLPSNHSLKGFGGTWKLAAHEWDSLNGEDSLRFTLQWLAELKRLVKPTGSIWIHATYHNSGIVNVACQSLGLEIINEVIWYKRNAFPNLSNRRLTASHEAILWVHTGGKKRRYRFNYQEARRACFAEDKLKEADTDTDTCQAPVCLAPQGQAELICCLTKASEPMAGERVNSQSAMAGSRATLKSDSDAKGTA